jgi:hypothetical protein
MFNEDDTVFRVDEALHRLMGMAIPPNTRDACEDAKLAVLDLMDLQDITMQAAQHAAVFAHAHDEWERAQASGGAALVERQSGAVLEAKSALRESLISPSGSSELQETAF